MTRESYLGRYAISEKEEMIRETLRSLYGLLNREDWLEPNILALGCSHLEYGVTSDMYGSFVDAMLECARAVFGREMCAEQALLFRWALTEITQCIAKAAEAVERAKGDPAS